MWWLCRSGTRSCSPVYSQPGERYRQVQSGALRSGARPVHGQQRRCWALCACPFLAGLGMTPLRLLTNKQPCLRFGMVEPHRNAGAGGILQGLGLGGWQLHPGCAGRAAAVGVDECVPSAQRGQSCGLPTAAGARVRPFGSTGDGRAPAPGSLQNGFGRSRGAACQNVLS